MKQQKVQAILMATDKPSNIHSIRFGRLYTTPNLSKSIMDIEYDLIIISDEEIKEGDWIYHKDKDSAEIMGSRITKATNQTKFDYNEFWFKIIASTDKSLGLPAPDNNSIQYIIDEFNSGKTEVYGVVDYEVIPNIHVNTHLDGSVRNAVHSHEEIIKTNPDNTISIKPIEENTDIDSELEKLITENKILKNQIKLIKSEVFTLKEQLRKRIR